MPCQAASLLDIGTRPIFAPEHDMFRESARKFFQAEVVPHHDEWEAVGHVPRELWAAAGSQGLLGCTTPAAYGGAEADQLCAAIVWEEQAYVLATGPGFSLHSDIVMPYIWCVV